MAVEKKVAVDLIEISGNNVQVRTRTSMFENGVEISASFHRHVVMPGECTTNEDPRVQAVCAGIHTQEVVAAYRAELARVKAEQDAATAKAQSEADAARIAAEEEMLKQQLDQQAAFDKAVAEAVRKALTGGQ